jgi:hypothetical protein
MVVQYKGMRNGIPTTFTIRLNGNNLSKSSSNYEVNLFIGEKGTNQLPFFTTSIHQSLYNCLKEIYLFTKHNHIKFDSSSEKTEAKSVPYDQVVFNFNKPILFLA